MNLVQAETVVRNAHEIAEKLTKEFFGELDPTSYRITVIALTKLLVKLVKE